MRPLGGQPQPLGQQQRPQPVHLAHPGRIVVIGDVHGDVGRLLLTLISLNIFTEDLVWIADPPNTIVVQLGDQVDGLARGGPNDWDMNTVDLNVMLLMDKLDENACAAGGGGRVLSIIGNHEMLNVFGSFSFVSPASLSVVSPYDRALLFKPGHGQFARILANRNVIIRVGPYLFCHGGLLLQHLVTLNNKGYSHINHLNVLLRRFLNGEQLSAEDREILMETVLGDNGILWNRRYLQLLLQNDENKDLEHELKRVLTSTNTRCMFIGHNVVANISGVADSSLFFVDAGLSRAFAYDRIQVLEIRSSPHGDDVNIIDIKN